MRLRLGLLLVIATVQLYAGGRNRPPYPFHLLSPINGSIFLPGDSVRLVWQRSIDDDWDTVTYRIEFSQGSMWTLVGTTRDTSMLLLPALFGYVPWRVTAIDRFTLVPSIEVFWFQVGTSYLPWYIQTSGTTRPLYSVKAVSRTVAWTVGDFFTVRRTTNGGQNWLAANGPYPEDAYVVEAVDANNAFAATAPGVTAYIYRTSNGGATWIRVFQQVGGFINAIRMFDATNGIAVGDPVGGKWTILRTTTGGAMWLHDTVFAPAQVGNDLGWNNSFASIGTTHIWFGTSSNRLYRSTNWGTTWSVSSTPLPNAISVAFGNQQEGLIGSTTGALARTTDGGVTWLNVAIPGSGSVAAISWAGSSLGYFAARGASIYLSTDRGNTWRSSFPGGIWTIQHMSFVSSPPSGYTNGWAVSTTGGIAEYLPYIEEVDTRKTEAPTEFVLYQNYPNPFNPTTTIEYKLPHADFITLKVFNMLGQEVRTLVNEHKEAGHHVVRFSAEDLPSGVYLYGLETSRSNQARKLLILR
ncbi:MAG: T9SS type A sorting domain-containing protein [Bacteroidota bacterium]